MDKLELYIESIIFAATEPVSFDYLQKALTAENQLSISRDQIEHALDRLVEKYESDDFSFGITAMNNGYLFMTKTQYHPVISEYLKLNAKKKLTKTALETLAIVAYKQPVTKADINAIRGVNSDYILQKLLEKELIVIGGRSEEVGRPLLYHTSERFLEYFGLKSIKDLPRMKEVLPEETDSIGEPAPIETNSFEDKEEPNVSDSGKG